MTFCTITKYFITKSSAQLIYSYSKFNTLLSTLIFNVKTFKRISAASVLRMMFNVFDREACLLALRDYLRKRMYLTARPADLWESFESFVSIPVGNKTASVAEVMNTWTNQSGYPVVNATLTDNILTLTQVTSYSSIMLLFRHFFTIF
jgi:hypothetical protein